MLVFQGVTFSLDPVDGFYGGLFFLFQLGRGEGGGNGRRGGGVGILGFEPVGIKLPVKSIVTDTIDEILDRVHLQGHLIKVKRGKRDKTILGVVFELGENIAGVR